LSEDGSVDWKEENFLVGGKGGLERGGP
jgi:hypothetical protein